MRATADIDAPSSSHITSTARRRGDRRSSARQIVDFAGERLWLAPPEYVIIRKLEFYREGRSEKHLRDIRGMLAVTDINRTFVKAEVATRGLDEFWRTCQVA